jgi:hypothetical protein
LLEIRYVGEFCLIECKSWIDEWLLLEHVYIHSINYYICLYVDAVWIGVIVCEVWMKMEKCGFLVKNELVDDLDVNWGFYFMFVVFLIAFKSMLTKKQVCGMNLGLRGIKNGGLDGKMNGFLPKNRVSCSGATRQASSWPTLLVVSRWRRDQAIWYHLLVYIANKVAR